MGRRVAVVGREKEMSEGESGGEFSGLSLNDFDERRSPASRSSTMRSVLAPANGSPCRPFRCDGNPFLVAASSGRAELPAGRRVSSQPPDQ